VLNYAATKIQAGFRQEPGTSTPTPGYSYRVHATIGGSGEKAVNVVIVASQVCNSLPPVLY
jgi:hypothetical protein